MKKKYLLYAVLPVVGLGFLGVNAASAHGLWRGAMTNEQIVQMQTTRFEEQASLLGVSVDDVKNAWASGKTMQDLAKEKGISETDLQAKIKAQREAQMKTHLQAMVSAGTITQAQADQRLTFMQNNQGKGVGRGGKGGRGIGMGMGF